MHDIIQITSTINFFIMEKSKEMVSLNTEVSEFELQQLEQRLETDPLAIGGLLNLSTNESTEIEPLCLWDNICGEH